MNTKIILMYLTGFYSAHFAYAQVLPKAAISRKRSFKTKQTVNRNAPALQMSLFKGVWSDCSACNAIFYTEGNLIKFFDHIGDNENEKEYRTHWKISNSKLSFYYSGGVVVTDDIIKLTKDSLILYRKGAGKSRYVRLK